MLELNYSNQVATFLKKSDKQLSERIIARIEKLQMEPFPQNMKKIEGQQIFRIRVGDYRILYEVDYKNNELGIIKIDKRSRVYD